MTKKQKLRRNSFTADFNTGEEDDFILADLDVMLDEEEPSPVPLNHFLDDEDVIDRLLIGANYNADDELELADALVIDNINLTDDSPGFDQFAIEPIEQTEQHQQTEVEEIPVSDIYSMADFDEIPDEEDAIDRLLVDTGFDANDELEQDDGKPDLLVIDDISLADEFDVNFDEQNAMTTDTAIFDPEKSKLALEKEGARVLMVQEESPETVKQEQTIVETTAEIKPEPALDNLNNPGITELNPFRTEQEAIKKQINDCENKVKKAAVISYASLGFGFVALLSTVVMGIMVFGVQTKTSKLSDLVSILEEDMGSIAGKNPDLEINNSDPSLEQLNKKTNGLPEHLEEQTQSSSEISEKRMTADVTKQAAVNKSLNNLQAKPPVLEKKKPLKATVEKVSAEKKVQVQNLLIKQSQSSTDASKNKMTTVATKLATVNKSNDKLQPKTPVLEKKKPSEAVVKRGSAEKKAKNKARTAAGWSVNLTAYKDPSYAKSKTAKFLQKNIPVKVIAVNMNNTTWYQLKVGSFKNKEEATSYAAKIKKSLNLNSVSVGNN
jgi:cell division protein FtsN